MMMMMMMTGWRNQITWSRAPLQKPHRCKSSDFMMMQNTEFVQPSDFCPLIAGLSRINIQVQTKDIQSCHIICTSSEYSFILVGPSRVWLKLVAATNWRKAFLYCHMTLFQCSACSRNAFCDANQFSTHSSQAQDFDEDSKWESVSPQQDCIFQPLQPRPLPGYWRRVQWASLWLEGLKPAEWMLSLQRPCLSAMK